VVRDLYHAKGTISNAANAIFGVDNELGTMSKNMP
jgi:hypothetical protein